LLRRVVGIYDHGKQHAMYEALSKRGRMYGVLYYLGMETGLRIGDLLALSRPLMGAAHSVREQKTGKSKRFLLSPVLVAMLHDYQMRLGASPDRRLFPVSRQTVHKHFKAASAEIGLTDIGPHSMRKSYAWNVLTLTHSFNCVKIALNHKFLSTTMFYITEGVSWLIRAKYGNFFSGIPPSLLGVPVETP
jgi:integrase